MKSLLLSMLEVSLGASVVILLMFLIAPLAGKRFSAKWRYWVWMLLAVRLMLPFEVNLPQPQLSIPIPQQLMVEQDFVPKTKMEDDISVPAVPAESHSGIVVETQTIAPTIKSESKARWTPSGLELLTILWAVGVVVSVIWQSINYLRWKNEGKVWNRMVEDGAVLNLYYDLCREQGISKFPKLVRNKRVQSPMMMGLLDPVIIFPQMEYSEEDYAVVLTHELNHYKRRDLWYKLLMLAACCVHWFNPLVWLMLREAGNDLEITCDEAVVKNHSSEDRTFYCEAILRIMCRGKGRYAVLSTGFNGGKKVLQRRFEAVLNDRASKGFVLGAVTMALLVFFSSFISCDVKEAQEQPSEIPVVNEENKAENTESFIEYAAIPEELRWIGERVEHLQPTSGQLDYRWVNRLEFWEKQAGAFFMVGFDMNESISSEDLARFFGVVANTQHLCNYNEWRTITGDKVIYEMSSDDVWGVLRSHLPVKVAHNFEPTEYCEEDSSPIRYFEELDRFLLTSTANQFDPIVTETLSVVEEDDVITVELASYDVDKYYAEPQEKVLLETYKFSVRVAYDSWYVLEADIVEHGA